MPAFRQTVPVSEISDEGKNKKAAGRLGRENRSLLSSKPKDFSRLSCSDFLAKRCETSGVRNSEVREDFAIENHA